MTTLWSAELSVEVCDSSSSVHHRHSQQTDCIYDLTLGHTWIINLEVFFFIPTRSYWPETRARRVVSVTIGSEDLYLFFTFTFLIFVACKYQCICQYCPKAFDLWVTWVNHQRSLNHTSQNSSLYMFSHNSVMGEGGAAATGWWKCHRSISMHSAAAALALATSQLSV